MHQNDGIFMRKFIETITTSIFYLKFKESNENDMTAHAIIFDFCNQPLPSRTGQNTQQALAATHSQYVCGLFSSVYFSAVNINRNYTLP
jgi:hypothetical protein